MTPSELEAYHELTAYTLTHGNPTFIHQHVVDAFAAQRANEESKPISVAFALAGLYLYLEKRYTGREVQRAHMQMARQKREWPRFALPPDRGDVTAIEVVAVPEGAARDAAIRGWCESVWHAHAVNRQAVIALCDQQRGNARD